MQPYRMHHEFANGVRVCVECRTPLESADGCRRKRVPLRCPSCKAACDAVRLSGQREARYAVRDAIKAGTLPSPRGLACTDCGGIADRYDHRNYSRPLEVEPVCIRCNFVRGPAVKS